MMGSSDLVPKGGGQGRGRNTSGVRPDIQYPHTQQCCLMAQCRDPVGYFTRCGKCLRPIHMGCCAPVSGVSVSEKLCPFCSGHLPGPCIGPCASDACVMFSLPANGAHKCGHCKGVLHAMCGVPVNPDEGELGPVHCSGCRKDWGRQLRWPSRPLRGRHTQWICWIL